MSDPYRNDPDVNRTDPSMNCTSRNRSESNSGLWMGLLIAAAVIIGGFMFLSPQERQRRHQQPAGDEHHAARRKQSGAGQSGWHEYTEHDRQRPCPIRMDAASASTSAGAASFAREPGDEQHPRIPRKKPRQCRASPLQRTT